MDFKETYKKYLDGTANDEEKNFIEAEIERARLVNSEIISSANNTETKKVKKKKSPRQYFKIVIIAVVTFAIILLGSFALVYGVSLSNALDNINIEPDAAKQSALEYTYMYARDHYGYSGPMEMLISEHDYDSRELIFKFPFDDCYYVYEYEFIAGNMEFDVQVNSSTGMPHIVDIDKID